jgi:hypothetical protein
MVSMLVGGKDGQHYRRGRACRMASVSSHHGTAYRRFTQKSASIGLSFPGLNYETFITGIGVLRASSGRRYKQHLSTQIPEDRILQGEPSQNHASWHPLL